MSRLLLLLAFLLFASPAFGAWAFQNATAALAHRSSGTTLVMSIPAENAEVGNVLICVLATDNATSGDASDPTSNEHVSMTDDQSNTYVKLAEQRNGEANPNQGVTVSLWYADITTQLTNSVDTITFTISDARTAKSGACWEYTTGFTGTLVTKVGKDAVSTDADPANLTGISGLDNVEHLWLRVDGKEDNGETWAADASAPAYTNRSVQCSSGGGADGNVCMFLDSLVLTATSDGNLPTDESDTYAAIFVALDESAAPTGLANYMRIIN